ncbi:MAG: nucleotidyltransferase domain-containing protein [Bacteroidales bacterium]|nr:nucleotidyltransferase domain-containing protein [Bacteroidales bacterium]MCF8333920.1 nucleotidyltransferase domain-containing protein [Bacteroidales bacterium]
MSKQNQTEVIDKATINQIVNKLARKGNPDKIYLFGSYAAKSQSRDSDIDLLIIKDTNKPRHQRSIEFQRILIGTKLPVDVIVFTNNEFEKEKKKPDSFINSVLKEANLI